MGRDSELAVMDEVLARPEATGIVLAGPVGRGKTRLASECLRLARGRGMATAAVAATRSARSVGLGALAPLLPPAAESAASPAPGVPGSGALTADVLRRAADALAAPDGGRRVIVVDDAHLLDDASATVLHHLGTARRATLVVTIRSGEPVPDPVTALWKDAGAERIEVRPLDRAGVDDLVRAGLGGRASGPTLHAVWSASLGNPLVARELVLAAVDAGTLRADGGVWRLTERAEVPTRLVEIVGDRLTLLDPPDRAGLELLAMAQELALPLLASLAGEATVARLERHGLVTVSSGPSGATVALAHPIYGEVVRATTTGARTMEVCRMLADAAEAAGTTDPGQRLRLAVWRLDGGGQVTPELLLDAARTAFFAHDMVVAHRLATAALARRRGAAAALVAAQALVRLGRPAEADLLLADVAAEATDDRERTLIAIERAVPALWVRGDRSMADAILDEALRTVTEPAWRDEIVAQQASFDMLAGGVRTALDRAAPMVAHGRGRAFLTGAIATVPALALAGRAEDGAVLSARAVAERRRLGAEEEALETLDFHLAAQALCLVEAGKAGEAEQLCADGHARVVDENDLVGQAWYALLAGRAALLQGALGRAARWFGDAEPCFARLGHPDPQRWCLAGEALVAAMSGDARRTTRAVDALDRVAPGGLSMMETEITRARAWRLAVTGDVPAAASMLEDAGRAAATAGAHALAAAAWHDAARLGRAGAAAPALAKLAVSAQGALVAARAAHAAALAAGDGSALEQAGDRFEALGLDLYAAEAWASASGAYRRAGRGQAGRRAARRAGHLADRCPGARTPALTSASPAVDLTIREREVAVLAARGLTNRDIATALGLSVRTVENHLQRAYTKLGASRRSQLSGLLTGPRPE